MLCEISHVFFLFKQTSIWSYQICMHSFSYSHTGVLNSYGLCSCQVWSVSSNAVMVLPVLNVNWHSFQ